jgi:hypothetical protein
VQRVRRRAEYNRAVRPENGKVSDLRDPGGSDIVRNMDVDRDSNPVMANSPFKSRLGRRITWQLGTRKAPGH